MNSLKIKLALSAARRRRAGDAGLCPGPSLAPATRRLRRQRCRPAGDHAAALPERRGQHRNRGVLSGRRDVQPRLLSTVRRRRLTATVSKAPDLGPGFFFFGVLPLLRTGLLLAADWVELPRAKSILGSGRNAMLKTIAAFDRIGEENAFAVLARAMQLAAAGRDIINLGIGQPDFRTPGLHRRGRDQGAARRPSRLHARGRHLAAARSGGRRPAQALRGQGVARRGDDHAGRQADHVHVDHDVRRAGRRHPLSRSRFSDLSLDDRIHRRAADPGADPRGE